MKGPSPACLNRSNPLVWGVFALLIAMIAYGGRVNAGAVHVPEKTGTDELSDDLFHRPQYKYTVTELTHLARIADLLRVSVDDLVLLNPFLQDVLGDTIDADSSDDGDVDGGDADDAAADQLGADHIDTHPDAKTDRYTSIVISDGTEIVVPITFPVHPDMSPLKLDVLDNKFVGVYRSPLPYARVDELIRWYIEQLPAFGYRLHKKDDEGNGAVRFFSGGVVALGTVEVSPGDEENPTLVDVALVIEHHASPQVDEGLKQP